MTTDIRIVKRAHSYAYGNATTERASWELLVDGRLIDTYARKREAVAAAKAVQRFCEVVFAGAPRQRHLDVKDTSVRLLAREG